MPRMEWGQSRHNAHPHGPHHLRERRQETKGYTGLCEGEDSRQHTAEQPIPVRPQRVLLSRVTHAGDRMSDRGCEVRKAVKEHPAEKLRKHELGGAFRKQWCCKSAGGLAGQQDRGLQKMGVARRGLLHTSYASRETQVLLLEAQAQTPSIVSCS